MDNVAGWILELDRGEGFPFEGNYTGFLEKKMARLEAEAKVDNKRKKALGKELEASFRSLCFCFVCVFCRYYHCVFCARSDGDVFFSDPASQDKNENDPVETISFSFQVEQKFMEKTKNRTLTALEVHTRFGDEMIYLDYSYICLHY